MKKSKTSELEGSARIILPFRLRVKILFKNLSKVGCVDLILGWFRCKNTVMNIIEEKFKKEEYKKCTWEGKQLLINLYYRIKDIEDPE